MATNDIEWLTHSLRCSFHTHTHTCIPHSLTLRPKLTPNSYSLLIRSSLQSRAGHGYALTRLFQ